jgi:hypothetical protein
MEHIATASSIHNLDLESRKVAYPPPAFRIPTPALTRRHYATHTVVPGESACHGSWLVFTRHSFGQLTSNDEMIYLAHQIPCAGPILTLNITNHGNPVSVS